MNRNIYIEFNYTVNFKNHKRGFVFLQYKESLNKRIFRLIRLDRVSFHKTWNSFFDIP